ncbi:hypothetical protein [Teichococcus aerofrigidensis]
MREVKCVSLFAAAGRVLANPVLATPGMPRFDRAAVDGYGVGGPVPGPSGSSGTFRLVQAAIPPSASVRRFAC